MTAEIEIELQAMATMVLDSFREQKRMIATAESCTGGLIASHLTDIAGSSDVFERGFVTYSNEAKQELIGVRPETLEKHGAVSMETAIEMASGALKASNAHASVAVTGIAGPGGGSDEKPVGMVCIAVSTHEEGTYGEEFQFGKLSRSEIRQETVKAAFEMLLAYGITGEH